ncbi:MAG: GNAT family N-acetyltransferase [Acidobacteria bacterium]|nr:GNAT family N-acetyltransferase [Acidobacteriota bacterium]
MIIVTAADPRDTDAIADLIDELDRFYGATEREVRAAPSQIKATLFNSPPAAYALLAWDGKRLVGLATYSFLWPAEGVTSSLFLKELYVEQSHRRQGVGKLLMQRLCQLAADTQCSRVEWVTDEGNVDALRFYNELGTSRYPSKVFYRLEGAEVARLASGEA